MKTARKRNSTLIEGKRLFVRHPLKRDRKEFIQLTLGSRRFHHPWIQPASTPESYAAYLKYSQQQNVRSFLICRIQDSRIVGACTLSQIFKGNFQNAYLGFWIAKEFAGQGYMREALQIVLQYSFDTLRRHRIEANIQPGNMRSKALVSSVGFRLEGFSPRYLKVLGRWRDHERFAICREEFSERVTSSIEKCSGDERSIARRPGEVRPGGDHTKRTTSQLNCCGTFLGRYGSTST